MGNHNWYVATNDNTTFGLSAFTPTQASNFDSASNRLGINNATYDASGIGTQTNMGGYTNVYDAENRVKTSKLNASVGFSYDGLGQRVQKINCPGAENPCIAASPSAVVTTFLYDAAGNLAVESGPPLGAMANGVAMCGTPTCYLSVDQVGSTRLITDANGAAQHRYDYLPFGEEIPVSTNSNYPSWRTTSMGYAIGPDGFSIKYTGQYRDPETGLDYFNARYYSPTQGRFVSPDPGNAGADPANPATWNGYSYVGGNPVNLTDPSGEGWLNWVGGALEVLSLIPGLQWLAPIGAIISGGSTINSLGGFSTGGAGGLNGGLWNEQVPGLGGGSLGSLNTGGVFGQGQTSPFVFSYVSFR